jgi:predicted aldo/keto reductase-like oxidoreductase
VDVIDYYLIHALEGVTWDRAKELGIVDFMKKAKESGKIVNIGFSFHGPRDDFKRIIDEYDWDFCQIQFNILDKNFQAGAEGLDYARSKGIGVIIMEPLRGGLLAGKLPGEVEKIYRGVHAGWSNVEWSLRWIWNHPGVITILSGMNTIEQIDENIRIAGTAEVGSMRDEELKTVDDAAATFRRLMKVPCTACQYCMPCPAKVNIPSSFHFYNNKHLFKQGLFNRMFYLMQHGEVQGRKASLASQCVDCGKCVEHCPQNIDIPSELKNVVEEFEGFWARPLTFVVNMMFSSGRRRSSDD